MIDLKKENTLQTQIAIKTHRYTMLSDLNKLLEQGYTFIAQVQEEYGTCTTADSILILQKPITKNDKCKI